MQVQEGDIINCELQINWHLAEIAGSQDWITLYAEREPGQEHRRRFKCSLLETNSENGNLCIGPLTDEALNYLFKRKRVLVEAKVGGYEMYFDGLVNKIRKANEVYLEGAANNIHKANCLLVESPTELYLMEQRHGKRIQLDKELENGNPLMMTIQTEEAGMQIVRMRDLSATGARIEMFTSSAGKILKNKPYRATIEKLGSKRGKCLVEIKRLTKKDNGIWDAGCQFIEMSPEIKQIVSELVPGASNIHHLKEITESIAREAETPREDALPSKQDRVIA